MNRENRLESNSDAEDEPEDHTDKIIKKYKWVMLFCLSYVMLAEVRCHLVFVALDFKFFSINLSS